MNDLKNKFYIECGYVNRKLRLDFDFIDPDINDWVWIFKSILTFLTYHPDTIKEIFNGDHCE